MSVDDSRAAVHAAVRDLWLVMTELVLSTNDDQPEQNDLVSAENVAQLSLELQGRVAGALGVLAGAAPASTADTLRTLCTIEQLVREAGLIYWRDLRAHGPVSRLRGSTRRRSGAWPSWCSGVEQSLDRCEDALVAAGRAVHTALQELAPLIPTDPSRADVSRRSS